MTYETKLEKSRWNGWTAKTHAIIGTVPATETEPAGERVLTLSTSKNDNGTVSSFASVAVSRDTGRGYKVQIYAMFKDFTKRLPALACSRVTERVIRNIHAVDLEQFPALIEEAKAFYAVEQENIAA